MARQQAALPRVSPEQQAAVERELRRRDLAPRQRERLEMAKAVALGQDLPTIARWSGRTEPTVRRWLGRFAAGGVEALSDAPRPTGERPKRRSGRRRARSGSPSTCGPPIGSAPTSRRRPGCGSRRAGCGRCWGAGTTSAGGPSTPSSTCRIRRRWRRARRSWPRRPGKVAAEPERYELHHEDETHVETNPYLSRVWHRRGEQPTVPAAGTNRRLTVFGSVETRGRGRVEVVCAGQDSACFGRYLAALDARHAATGK